MNDNQSLEMRNIIRFESIPAATSVELGERSILEDINENIHSEWLQPLVNDNLKKEEANNRKRIIAKAIVIGIKRGAIRPMTAFDIASLIDEGVTRTIVFGRVGEGKMDSYEAMDVLIDHAATRVITIADKIITKVEKGALKRSDVIADTLVDGAATGLKFVASAFPPTRVLVPFIDTIAHYIKPVVRTVVKKGITIVAKAARTFVKKAGTFIVERAKKVGRVLKRAFSFLS